MGLVNEFVSSVEASVLGYPGQGAFMKKVNAAFNDYKQQIWDTAPKFTPYTESEIKWPGFSKKRDYDVSGDVVEIRNDGTAEKTADGTVIHLDQVRVHIKK
jgi:hypothetical protein